MTAYLLPEGKQSYETATGAPAVGWKLYTTDTGTNNPRSTWADAAQTSLNANPIVMDARGECVVFWSGAYRVRLEDNLGNTIYTVEGVSVVDLTAALRADLASTADVTKGAALIGFNPALLYGGTTVGSFLSSIYKRTAAEIAAGVVPINYNYPPYWVPRYGTNTTPGVTNCATMIQNAVNAAAAAQTVAYLPAFFGEANITTAIAISTSRCGLVGDANGNSRLLVTGAIDGITVAAGLSFIHIRDISIAFSVRYTVAVPNTQTGVKMNGTTASAILYSEFNNLFVDGFETAIRADGLRDSKIDGLTVVFCKNGLIAAQLTTSVQLTNFDISGGDIANNFFPSSVGIRIGDGTAAAEGWFVGPGVTYRHATGFDALASSNHQVHNLIIDQAAQFGVLLRSSVGACTGCALDNVAVYMISNAAVNAGVADSGFFLTNSIAPSAGADFGHSFTACTVFQYVGTTLTNGFLCSGTQEANHRLIGGSYSGDTLDVSITAGTKWIVTGVHAPGNGFFFATGVNPRFDNNFGTVSGIVPDVASAATLVLPIGPKNYTISGVTNITSITATGHADDTVGLTFAGILTVTDGLNLKLNGNFVTTADDSLVLWCDGTNWFERSRSAN